MATFDDSTVGTSTGGTTPDFRMTRSSKPALTETKFQDGYSQRIKFGMNINPRSWVLAWTAKDETDADAIEAFFDARIADGASFDWTPPNESSASKWFCRSWQRSANYANVSSIRATFDEVFEP
tara:strand:- start:27 stop:398 length:372 start_codon:yes stop_codon:yes gene_type:complete